MATGIQVAVTLLMLCVILTVGRLSDRIGRKPILMMGSVALIVLGLPAVWLLREGLAGQVLGLLIMGGTLVCFAAVAPSTLPALFPTLIRYGGLAVTFNLAVSIFAGTAPAANLRAPPKAAVVRPSLQALTETSGRAATVRALQMETPRHH